MSYGVGNVGGVAGGYGPGYGCVSPVSTGCGGFSSLGIILVLFILLVIISRSILF